MYTQQCSTMGPHRQTIPYLVYLCDCPATASAARENQLRTRAEPCGRRCLAPPQATTSARRRIRPVRLAVCVVLGRGSEALRAPISVEVVATDDHLRWRRVRRPCRLARAGVAIRLRRGWRRCVRFRSRAARLIRPTALRWLAAAILDGRLGGCGRLLA